MIQLSDELIRAAFVKTGFDEKYFALYKEDVIRRYHELQQGDTGEDETSEDERNVMYSICDANVYMSFYVREIEKGHSETWASKLADELSLDDEDEFFCVYCTYSSIEDEELRERDFDIHVNSLSDNVFFKERYEALFHKHEIYTQEKAEEYWKTYYRCNQDKKSTLYAFANEVNNRFNPKDGASCNIHFVDIHSLAIEQAIRYGMDEDQAFQFGDCCLNICANDSWRNTSIFLERYHEDWQKALYLYLYRKDYLHRHNREVSESELNDLKRELYKYLPFPKVAS